MSSDETRDGQRKRIAWCGNCGNVSVDGFNFGEGSAPGLLRCAACGTEGPYAYSQQAALLARLQGLAERLDDVQYRASHSMNEALAQADHIYDDLRSLIHSLTEGDSDA